MEYLLKSSGIVVILFLFYYLVLKNETFFKSIRSYFLIGLIIVISMPLIEIPIYIERATTQLGLIDIQNVMPVETTQDNSIDWIQILNYGYLLGVAFFSIKFLFELLSLGHLLSKNKMTKYGNYYFVETSTSNSPFSFFNIIVYNKSMFSRKELEQIINHEKAHALQWHSVDVILSHLLLIVLWFNPFVWLFKEAVQQNLEFLADDYASRKSENQKNYQLTLLKSYNVLDCTSLTNNFYKPLIKKRIIMLLKNRSQNRNQWKYAMLLPLLLVFVFTFNTKTIAQDKKLTEVSKQQVSKAILLIDKDFDAKKLAKKAKSFEKEQGIKLTFKGVKRNSDNEITAIKINAKGNGLEASFANSGDEAIKPIKISYDSKNNSLSINNVNKHKKSHYSYTIHDDGKIESEGGSSDGKMKYIVITSDEDGTHTIKESDSKILKEIEIETDGEHTWVKKSGENVSVNVMKLSGDDMKLKIIDQGDDGDEKEMKYEIKVTDDGDEENIIIIKEGDSDVKLHKIKSTDNLIYIDEGDDSDVLYIIDGKESNADEFKKLNKDRIKEISVIKGEKAVEKYGEKAKEGVIEISTEAKK